MATGQKAKSFSRPFSNRTTTNNNADSLWDLPPPPPPHAVSSSRPKASPSNSFSASSSTSSTASESELVTVLVGPTQKRFKLNKHLLCSSCPFFHTQLNLSAASQSARSGTTSTTSLASSSTSSLNASSTAKSSKSRSKSKSASSFKTTATTTSTVPSIAPPKKPKQVSLWLPSESPTIFSFFAKWLHSPMLFQWYLQDELVTARDDPKTWRKLHWILIRLHMFSSSLDLFHLQDVAMDTIQDFYRSCDWVVEPGLVHFLYTRCDPVYSVRLRRWAVAMVAYALASPVSPSPFSTLPRNSTSASSASSSDSAAHSAQRALKALLGQLEEFQADYQAHLEKMRQSGLNVRYKNPRVRIFANQMNNDERAFGFRECSFHSHRAAAGEGRCPHEKGMWMATDSCSSFGTAVAVVEDASIPGGLGVPRWKDMNEDSKEEEEKYVKPVVKLIDVVRKGSVVEIEKKKKDEETVRFIKEEEEEGEEGHARAILNTARRNLHSSLFSRGQERERMAEEKALKHMRSISSVLG